MRKGHPRGRGRWIEKLLLGENGTNQLPRAPHACSAVSRCLVSAHRARQGASPRGQRGGQTSALP